MIYRYSDAWMDRWSNNYRVIEFRCESIACCVRIFFKFILNLLSFMLSTLIINNNFELMKMRNFQNIFFIHHLTQINLSENYKVTNKCSFKWCRWWKFIPFVASEDNYKIVKKWVYEEEWEIPNNYTIYVPLQS